MGNLTGKMIYSCRDCTTALDMPPTQTFRDAGQFEIDARPMCDGCADRLETLGFTWLTNNDGMPIFICQHVPAAARAAWGVE